MVYYQLSQPSLLLELKQFHPSHRAINTVPFQLNMAWSLGGYRDVDMMMTVES